MYNTPAGAAAAGAAAAVVDAVAEDCGESDIDGPVIDDIIDTVTIFIHIGGKL
jgi:hypothetical protein